MEEKITQLLKKYQGQTIEFAIGFEKEHKTLPQHLVTLFEDETRQAVKEQSRRFLDELEKMVLMYNNQVVMSKLTRFREELEK